MIPNAQHTLVGYNAYGTTYYPSTSESILCDYYYISWTLIVISSFTIQSGLFWQNCPNPNGNKGTKKIWKWKNHNWSAQFSDNFPKNSRRGEYETNWIKKKLPPIYLCHLPRQSPDKKFNFAIKHFFAFLFTVNLMMNGSNVISDR